MWTEKTSIQVCFSKIESDSGNFDTATFRYICKALKIKVLTEHYCKWLQLALSQDKNCSF